MALPGHTRQKEMKWNRARSHALALGMLIATELTAHGMPGDSVAHKPMLVLDGDTLREVVVTPDKRLPVEDALRESLGKMPRHKSLGDALEKVSPGINDKITHPFAVKARKRERRNKRWRKRINDYDRVKTFDELLREAYEQQLREDSL